MSDLKAYFRIANQEYEFPILKGSLGPNVVDIQSFYKQTGLFTYDPGFTSTASCDSEITFIDGDKGELLYRGYRIEELTQQSNFLEVCSLLLQGELPNSHQMKEFRRDINHHTMVHQQLVNFYQGFRHNAHPMAIMIGVVGALSAFYHDEENSWQEDPYSACVRIIAKMPTLAAMAYKYSMGQPFVYPNNSLDFSENFLHMLFSLPTEKYHVSPVVARALDKIMILHADHEQNASTSTVRLAASSQANPFGCVAAGIACLWGPAHGGANEAVIRMLQDIGSIKNIPTFLARAKDKDDPFRLMGFGHRVYKNYDPRAAVLRDDCHAVLKELGQENEPLFALALALEEMALKDEYFIEKKLFPNVDFYSGIILRAMGIPLPMFTVLFAVARSAGWVANWLEMRKKNDSRIGRPRQLYTGPIHRKFVLISERT